MGPPHHDHTLTDTYKKTEFDGETFTAERRFTLAGAPDDLRVTVGEREVGITYRDTYLIVTYDPDSPARHDFDGVPVYGAGRSLDIPSPDADGNVILDFNRIVNLPCAFSEHFPICPLPPSTNRLPFAI